MESGKYYSHGIGAKYSRYSMRGWELRNVWEVSVCDGELDSGHADSVDGRGCLANGV